MKLGRLWLRTGKNKERDAQAVHQETHLLAEFCYCLGKLHNVLNCINKIVVFNAYTTVKYKSDGLKYTFSLS